METAALPRPWWERPEPAAAGAVQCRDATPGENCIEERYTSTQCTTEVDPATGEPVRHCVKLYKRYLKCAGQPEKVDEQKREVTARGRDAQQLGPDLLELPAASSSRRAAEGSGAPGGAPAAAAQMEDVGHAFEEFLRFAEELQEEMVPGVVHLDEPPAPQARPYSEGDAAALQQPGEQQHFSWLGGLLFGKRGAGAQDGSGARRRAVDAATWREFERDFTEV